MRYRVLVPRTFEDGHEEYVQYGPVFLNREAAERARAALWSSKEVKYWGPEQRAVIREEAEQLRQDQKTYGRPVARPAYPAKGE